MGTPEATILIKIRNTRGSTTINLVSTVLTAIRQKRYKNYKGEKMNINKSYNFKKIK